MRWMKIKGVIAALTFHYRDVLAIKHFGRSSISLFKNLLRSTIPSDHVSVPMKDDDPRRLSMEDLRKVLLKFNVPEEDIANQTRWYRIAMIRRLQREQAAYGGATRPVKKILKSKALSIKPPLKLHNSKPPSK